MNTSSFKQETKNRLIVLAQDYFLLLNKLIILESSNFIYQSKYVLKFTKTNFLHLTGVITNLNANDFYENWTKKSQ